MIRSVEVKTGILGTHLDTTTIHQGTLDNQDPTLPLGVADTPLLPAQGPDLRVSVPLVLRGTPTLVRGPQGGDLDSMSRAPVLHPAAEISTGGADTRPGLAIRHPRLQPRAPEVPPLRRPLNLRSITRSPEEDRVMV